MSEWKNIKDEIPEKEGHYLIFTLNRDQLISYYTKERIDGIFENYPEIYKGCKPTIYNNINDHFQEARGRNLIVTHWKELDQPTPKTKEEICQMCIHGIWGYGDDGNDISIHTIYCFKDGFYNSETHEDNTGEDTKKFTKCPHGKW